MALKDIWRPRVDNVDDADSSAVNEIADAVIELEENMGDIETALDNIIAIQNELMGVSE